MGGRLCFMGGRGFIMSSNGFLRVVVAGHGCFIGGHGIIMSGFGLFGWSWLVVVYDGWSQVFIGVCGW